MMDMKKTLISVAAGIAMAGCGGGSGGGTVAPEVLAPLGPTVSGKAVDGYLSQSSVFCDKNGNGLADAGEISVSTGPQGDFTFSPGCSYTLVAVGGTNADTNIAFKGLLKAPSGSLYLTPLTSLMVDGGLSAAQIAAAMGFSVDIDVSKIDPMTNIELQKKTLAVQQIIQQIADTLAGLSLNSSPAALTAIYSAATKSVVTTLRANPGSALIEAGGNVSTSLVSSIIVDSLKEVQASTDTALLVAKISLSAYSAVSIAELTSSAIASEAQTLAQAGNAALLLDSAKLLQANTTISNAALSLAPLLTVAKESSVSLTNVGSGLTLLVVANSGNDGAATTALANAVSTEAAKADISAPVLDIVAWSKPSNTLALRDDSIELNGKSYPLTEFAIGVTLDKKVSPLDIVSFSYEVKGTPIPDDADGMKKTNVSLGIEMSDVGTKGQVLQFILDQAEISITGGQLAVAVPAGAKLYAYGRTGNGTAAFITMSNISADEFVVVADNKLSFNAGKVLNKLVDTRAQLSNLRNITGTFNLKVAVTNLSIVGQTKTSVQGLSVSVTGSNQAMTGLGVNGVFTIN
jgi:hypothetical protein